VFDTAIDLAMYYYISTDKTRRLSGRLIRPKIAGSREEDVIDVAVLKLDGELLPPYREVEKYAMDISYLKESYRPRDAKHYVLIGFPATKSRVKNNSKDVEVMSYAYRNDSVPEYEYSQYGLSPETHVVLPLNLKKGFDANGKKTHFPKPQGMSGAPVFVLHDDNEQGSKVFPVVAVAIEYRKKEKVLVATDVRYVLEAISNAG
jgi:hypothetical protein